MPRWNKEQKKVYATLLSLHADKSSELYTSDGRQRKGANIRCAFWEGYNGMDVKHRIPAGSMLMAAYHAGIDCRRRAGGRPPMPEDQRPKVRSVRLNQERWEKLQRLGRPWLETAIDDAKE